MEDKKLTFEDYLRDQHASQYVGTDDMMIDDFNDWIKSLFVDEWIEFGNKFAKKLEVKK